MRKRVLSALLAAMLLLGMLSGCGGENPPAETGSNPPAENTQGGGPDPVCGPIGGPE